MLFPTVDPVPKPGIDCLNGTNLRSAAGDGVLRSAPFLDRLSTAKRPPPPPAVSEIPLLVVR